MVFLAGDHDEATPSAIAHYASLIAEAATAVIANSGHLSMQDNPDAHNQALRDFLRRTDAKH